MKTIAVAILSALVLSGCATGYSLVRPYVHERHGQYGQVRSHFMSSDDPKEIEAIATQYCREGGYGKAVVGARGKIGEFATFGFKCERSAAQLEEDARRADEEKRLDEELARTKLAARDNASYECKGEEQCRKAFAVAQIYVVRNSDMKIQVSTDTIVETYNPTKDSDFGMRIVRMPLDRDLARIVVEVICPGGCNTVGKLAALRAFRAQAGFRPFMVDNVR